MASTRNRTKRTHEWLAHFVGQRTVCGQSVIAGKDGVVVGDTFGGVKVVGSLDTVAAAERCQNCERMRSATGTSSQGESE